MSLPCEEKNTARSGAIFYIFILYYFFIFIFFKFRHCTLFCRSFPCRSVEQTFAWQDAGPFLSVKISAVKTAEAAV
jgi:hypothetical protein